MAWYEDQQAHLTVDTVEVCCKKFLYDFMAEVNGFTTKDGKVYNKNTEKYHDECVFCGKQFIITQNNQPEG